MFPTTIWTVIRDAAGNAEAAQDRFARTYRDPVLAFLRARGAAEQDADDLCQDVFVRVFRSGVLQRADRERGRFRALLLTIAKRVMIDRARKRVEAPVEDPEPSPDPRGARDEGFDREWVLHLLARAMERLREDHLPSYETVRDRLGDRPTDRQRLWIARGRLMALLRAEVAMTCAHPEDVEEELRYLSRFLRPAGPDEA